MPLFGTGVKVGVGVGVGVGVEVGVEVGIIVDVEVGRGGVLVGVSVGVAEGASVEVIFGVDVKVGDGSADGVKVGSVVGVGDSVGVGVEVGRALAPRVARLRAATSVACMSGVTCGRPQATKMMQIISHGTALTALLHIVSNFSFTLCPANEIPASVVCPDSHIACGSDSPGIAHRKSEPAARR
jgi:hypothetical protein